MEKMVDEEVLKVVLWPDWKGSVWWLKEEREDDEEEREDDEEWREDDEGWEGDDEKWREDCREQEPWKEA